MSASSALEIAMTLDEAKEACSSTYTASSPLVQQAAESVSKRAHSDKEKLLPIESLGLAMASCSNTYSRMQRETGEDAIQLKRNERYGAWRGAPGERERDRMSLMVARLSLPPGTPFCRPPCAWSASGRLHGLAFLDASKPTCSIAGCH